MTKWLPCLHRQQIESCLLVSYFNAVRPSRHQCAVYHVSTAPARRQALKIWGFNLEEIRMINMRIDPDSGSMFQGELWKTDA